VTVIPVAAPSGVRTGTLIVLMFAVFTVSVGYGVVLPFLPGLIASLSEDTGNSRLIASSTGLLTSIYVIAIFLFAPIWGHASDRYGRRAILVLGMIGFGASMFMFHFVRSLPTFYLERFLSGVFAAAVTPVAAATIGDLAASDEARGRRLTLLSMAGITGFLVGPMLGLLLARLGTGSQTTVAPERILAVPLAGAGVFALLIAAATALIVPRATHALLTRMTTAAIDGSFKPINRLLAMAFIGSAAVGVFEVGLALRGSRELGFNQAQIALMFTECSLVMIVVQAITFSRLIKPSLTRFLMTPALGVLAVGLVLVPRASSFTIMLVIIAAIAASAGILLPIITYWISTIAGNAQGTELGKQTSAASLGSAIGSAAGGLLFDMPFPGASFAATAALSTIGIALSFRLPSRLGGLMNSKGIIRSNKKTPN
jgi:MFS family permease